MTNEEKAKAYDEALERAKTLMNKESITEGAYPNREACEIIFPELAESEDERIRKELITFICQFAPEHLKVKYVAYLEKQKEQKSIEDAAKEATKDKESAEKFLKTAGIMDKNGNLAEIYRSEQNPTDDKAFEEWIDDWYQGSKEAGGDVVMSEAEFKNWSRGIRNMYQHKPVSGSSEKPNNHAEWSEDYREEDIQTRFAFYTYKDDPSVLYLSNVFVEEASRNHGFGTRILKAAEKVAEAIGAITICLKVKQDSPANAWYRKRGYGYETFEDGYDWLKKKLEYLKPDKSAEWSEEDENKIESIKGLITMGKFVDTNTIRTIWKLLDSLRPQPHWKPSEEQMEVLNEVIGDEIMEDTASCEAKAEVLKTLYADLQKLL